MTAILKWINDQHWYIIAGVMIALCTFWTYGCESKCNSLITPQKQINRAELQNELNYIIGQAKVEETNLDKQDAVKQALLDAFNIMASTGSINPSGLINLASVIGAIAFGLNRNQVAKATAAKNITNST